MTDRFPSGFSFPYALFAGLIAALMSNIPALAHEENAPFSGAIIDPFELHHAHIEDEQRINLGRSVYRNRSTGERTRTSFSELELAWASEDFRFGMEVFIPYFDIRTSPAGDRETGVGDIEIRPLKYAFISEPELVVSTATGITLPTGDNTRGLGDGYTSIRQFLFIDKAVGNWFFGANLGIGTGLKSGTPSELEYGVIAAYSFISNTTPGKVAPARPDQQVVWTSSLELTGVRSFGGEESDQRQASLIGGINAWLPANGWQTRLGISLPISPTHEAARTILFQIGNHF